MGFFLISYIRIVNWVRVFMSTSESTNFTRLSGVFLLAHATQFPMLYVVLIFISNGNLLTWAFIVFTIAETKYSYFGAITFTSGLEVKFPVWWDFFEGLWFRHYPLMNSSFSINNSIFHSFDFFPQSRI